MAYETRHFLSPNVQSVQRSQQRSTRYKAVQRAVQNTLAGSSKCTSRVARVDGIAAGDIGPSRN